MRVLWIATKSPWPPRDGGRLLLTESLRAVSAAGVAVTLVAPVERGERAAAEEALRAVCEPRLVVARQRPRALAALTSVLSGRPYSLARHDRPTVLRAVERELRESARAGGIHFDAVVAEQLQAFAQSAAAEWSSDLPGARPVPRILRAQNVESDLWRQLGEASRGVVRALLLREAARLARAERAAVGAAAATIALSAADGERLCALAGPAQGSERIDARIQSHIHARIHANIQVLPPPFPGRLDAAGQRLAGSPALVLFGSAGWEPNRRGELRFVNEIWPRVRAASPTAALHWFAGSAGPAGSSGASGVGHPDHPGVLVHRSPATSAEAFAPGAILVLPLDIASGVRMRVLEAWARGVVMVASPEAASGLDAADGRELLLARSGPDYAQAIARLATDGGLAGRLIAGGRARLASDHAPERFAAGFVALVAQLAERPAGAVRR